jgi:hypothetical protein
MSETVPTIDQFPGPTGLVHEDVDTLLIPGRFRGPTGQDLSPESMARVHFAATFFHGYLQKAA